MSIIGVICSSILSSRSQRGGFSWRRRSLWFDQRRHVARLDRGARTMSNPAFWHIWMTSCTLPVFASRSARMTTVTSD